MSPLNILTPCSSKFPFNIVPFVPVFRNWSPLSGFQTKYFYSFIISMRSTLPINVMLLVLITLIVFGEEHKFWMRVLYNFPVTSYLSFSLSDPCILRSIFFVNTRSLCSVSQIFQNNLSPSSALIYYIRWPVESLILL